MFRGRLALGKNREPNPVDSIVEKFEWKKVHIRNRKFLICYSLDKVQTTKRGSVKGTKKDQFTITGNGTTKGGKMKIFVHVQTTGKNPNKAVPGKKQGKEAPNVKLGQSGETPSPSPTTTPPMSTQVTSASPKPKKGKHFQVTPKPPISGKIQSLKPSQSKKLAPSQSMKKHS